MTSKFEKGKTNIVGKEQEKKFTLPKYREKWGTLTL